MPADLASLAARYQSVRTRTEQLCAPLEVEDYQLQSMPDCSPPKWHLAHTAWFFETFVLLPHMAGYEPFHPRFGYLFNSYYDAVGDRWPRAARGLLSRPTVSEVYAYRRAVDDGMLALFRTGDAPAELIELGLNHEEQHQELLLTDLKHAFGLNPLKPAYAPAADAPPAEGTPLRYSRFPAGVRVVGHSGNEFAFDNEGPPHRVYVNAFELASRPVSAGEFLRFMDDGGYERPEFWLSDGWSARRQHGWGAPLYWERDGRGWSVFTLRGVQALAPGEAVCHVSFYEADAYARWAGARLPTEFEWETAVRERGVGNMPGTDALHPGVSGGVWEWTASPYTAYPGFKPAAGAVGEYNGKFMCNQMVLRGNSCATPPGHARPTYRNFFPPDARWQFSGLRLAKDVPE